MYLGGGLCLRPSEVKSLLVSAWLMKMVDIWADSSFPGTINVKADEVQGAKSQESPSNLSGPKHGSAGRNFGSVECLHCIN